MWSTLWTLTTKEYVWVERVRYSALQTPMQSSTGPPGEWGSRASAMSHTILQTDTHTETESEHASDIFSDMFTPTYEHALTSQRWYTARGRGYSGLRPPERERSPSPVDPGSPPRSSPAFHPHEVLSEGQSVGAGGAGDHEALITLTWTRWDRTRLNTQICAKYFCHSSSRETFNFIRDLTLFLTDFIFDDMSVRGLFVFWFAPVLISSVFAWCLDTFSLMFICTDDAQETETNTKKIKTGGNTKNIIAKIK